MRLRCCFCLFCKGVTSMCLHCPKLPLYFNWALRPEGVLREWRYSSTHSLTSALDGGEWSASRPGRFTPRERAPWCPLDRRLGGPQSRSRHGGEEKNSHPLPGLELPIIQPVAQPYTIELSQLLISINAFCNDSYPCWPCSWARVLLVKLMVTQLVK
jgi:hypothetical protein